MKDDPPHLSRRHFLGWALGAGGLALAGVGGASVHEAYSYDVRVEGKPVPGLTRPLRMAVLTDLHLGPYLHERQLADWVRVATATRPDTVVLVGDLVDARYRGDLSEFGRRLPDLQSPLGTYVVPGNHDRYRYPDLAPWLRMLNDVGATVLLNEGRRVRDDLYLAGIDDFREGRPDPAAALAGTRGGAGYARVLLSHNPDVIPTLSTADGTVPDLLLCGHTHGGQICIPGIGAVYTGSDYGRRYLEGWVPAPTAAFVSRGLGVTLVPLRFDCPAELVVMDLVPA